MSIIVWDGITLAADRQGTSADMRFTEPKMSVMDGPEGLIVCAWTGTAAYGKALAHWYFAKRPNAEYPEFQKDAETWCRLIVARLGGCLFYEQTPYPFVVHDEFAAWGSGRDFAIGAMAMGATARKAVEVASLFSVGCGCGIEAYDL